MSKTRLHQTVDEYIAARAEPHRKVLERVRGIILKALPGAEESIAYGMPAYRMGPGRPVICFAGWKEHFSLYFSSDGVVKEFRGDLEGVEIQKGTISFSWEKVPVGLIKRIVEFRAGEVGRGSRKTAKPR